MIVDAHHHLWADPTALSWLDAPELAPIRRPFTTGQLAAELAAAGVQRSVLVEGGRCDPVEAPQLLGLVAGSPQIAGVVVWADPTDPALTARLDGYRRLPGGGSMVGVRSQVQADPDPDHLDRADVRDGLRRIAAAGLAFDLVLRVDQLPAAARAAAALPEVRFVLDHLGKPPVRDGAAGLRRWRGPFAALAACPNVTAKLSGLATEADWGRWSVDDLRPFVAEAVDRFGPHRLMVGSDWPVCLLAGDYRRTWRALLAALPPLPDPALADVLGGTATRVYRLADRAGATPGAG